MSKILKNGKAESLEETTQSSSGKPESLHPDEPSTPPPKGSKRRRNSRRQKDKRRVAGSKDKKGSGDSKASLFPLNGDSETEEEEAPANGSLSKQKALAFLEELNKRKLWLSVQYDIQQRLTRTSVYRGLETKTHACIRV